MPSLPDIDQFHDSHLAALVAINIVTQVLDKAQDIVNTAKDRGQSWRKVWCQKKGNVEFYENTEIWKIMAIKTDDKCSNDEINQKNNVMITSTPQKETEENVISHLDYGLIGQGDEDIQNRSTDLLLSSMLINSLFDMTNLEDSVTFEASEDNIAKIQSDPSSRNLLENTITDIVESYINIAIDCAAKDVWNPNQQIMVESKEKSNESSYLHLDDARISDVTENISFDIDSVNPIQEKELKNDNIKFKTDYNGAVDEFMKKDIEMYEKTFSTLNRDYEKCSEEEENFQEDRKSMTMQEVELFTNISSENLASNSEVPQSLTERGPVSSAAMSKRKDSLVKRCRLQGAKLMTRLRIWWWKQRLLGKRKKCRSGLIPGMCTYTPNALSRATSLLDQCKLRSPSPMRTVARKFNTVNEALIHSYNRQGSNLEINSSDLVEKY